jgi:hypothetical protein
MEGVCSAQVQAQNEHSKTKGSALNLQAAFVDINIGKGRSVYYWFGKELRARLSSIPKERVLWRNT